MPSELVTFSQVVAKAHQGEAAAGDELSESRGFGRRQRLTGPEAVNERYIAPSDRKLATAVTNAISELQDAMDAAIRAGLIVEPCFKTVSGRFNEFGVSVDSHICTVQIFRKLA